MLETFDHTILSLYHDLAVSAGALTTPLFYGISWLGSAGAIFIAIGLLLLAFKHTRKTGICVLLALAMGWILSDLVLKELIARPRPYANIGGEYHLWWQQVGAWMERSTSFPSGHTTVAAAAMFVIFWRGDKRWSWLAFIPILLMGASRNYLMVHYPSDVVGGIVVGALAAVLACILLRWLGRLWERRKEASKGT